MTHILNVKASLTRGFKLSSNYHLSCYLSDARF